MLTSLPVSRCKQRGISLVESMVALLVMSIGMLGVAALYVESLRSARSALTRTHAVALASDMADRIRANPTAGPAYIKTAGYAGTQTVACNAGSGSCSIAQMALNDIWLWNAMVDDRNDNPAAGQVGLPQGRGIITMLSTVPRVYQVTINWQDQGVANSYTLVVRT